MQCDRKKEVKLMLSFLVYQSLLVEHSKNKHKVYIDSHMARQGEDITQI